MRVITLLVSLFLLNINPSVANNDINLIDIKNFTVHSHNLASSGLPIDKLIAENNYQHIINLIPGDYSKENNKSLALGMSYHQIEVDWNSPKLSDFHRFAYYLHNIPENDKVLVHSKLNYRASTFAYLYQVIVKGEEESKAKEKLLNVWQPTPTWLNYMNNVLEYYHALPTEPF